MTDPDPLDTLATQAALASGWPTLHVYAADEAHLAAARSAVEATLGPLPQADEIEPWDEDDDDPRWELRVDLPDLDPANLPPLHLALQPWAHRWRPGHREGARAAMDLGARFHDRLEAGGIVAHQLLHEDGPLSLDLARARGGDDALAELEAELAHAVRRVDPAVTFRSDRGDDTVAPVVHRATGRFGVQLSFGADTFEGLDGDEVLARRRALVAALGDVLRARASHPHVRLAPDLLWDTPLGGLDLTAWFVARSVPALPADDTIQPGLSPSADALAALWADPSQSEDLELQVVPVQPSMHEAVAVRVAEALRGSDARGAAPRWLRAPRWVFCPVWRVSGPLPLADLAALEGVAAVRVVPGEPKGVGDLWPVAVPAWTWGPLRCLLRLRDGLFDRDRLPEAGPRGRRPRDAEVEIQVFAALVASEEPAGLLPSAPGPGQPIVDVTGREGLEFAFDARAFAEAPLRSALRAIGAAGHPDLAPVAHYAHRHDRTVVRLWYRGETIEPPRWR